MSLADEVSEQVLAAALEVTRGNAQRVPRRQALSCQHLAEVAGQVGRIDSVLEFLEAGDQAKLLDVSWMDGCPLLAGARDEPRFKAVRASVQRRAAEVLAILGADGRGPA